MKTVIEMAREAGIADAFLVTPHPGVVQQLERFAALVLANNPPKSSMAWQEGFEAGRLAEREACAKVCDEADKNSDWPIAANCAAAIRARGNK